MLLVHTRPSLAYEVELMEREGDRFALRPVSRADLAPSADASPPDEAGAQAAAGVSPAASATMKAMWVLASREVICPNSGANLSFKTPSTRR